MSIAQRSVQYELVKHVAQKLDSLVGQVVFIGGATVGLMLTEEGAPDVRETQDVDVIIEMINLSDYYSFNKKLIAFGFRPSSDVICRWVIDNIIVDCMPTDPSILGFSNIWYREAMEHANTISLDKDIEIRLISPPYLIATKLEAFFDRGNQDYLASHDMEDIICVFDGRKEIATDMGSLTSINLKKYIHEKFSYLLGQSYFIECIVGHLGSYPSDLQYLRSNIVQERIKAVINLIEKSV